MLTLDRVVLVLGIASLLAAVVYIQLTGLAT